MCFTLKYFFVTFILSKSYNTQYRCGLVPLIYFKEDLYTEWDEFECLKSFTMTRDNV